VLVSESTMVSRNLPESICPPLQIILVLLTPLLPHGQRMFNHAVLPFPGTCGWEHLQSLRLRSVKYGMSHGTARLAEIHSGHLPIWRFMSVVCLRGLSAYG
jgi:hypothetical protein